jgi:hypothetical protein
MKLMLDPGAGAAVTGLFLGSLAIAAAVAVVTAPITPRAAAAREESAVTRVVVHPSPLVSPVASVQSAVRTNPDD